MPDMSPQTINGSRKTFTPTTTSDREVGFDALPIVLANEFH